MYFTKNKNGKNKRFTSRFRPLNTTAKAPCPIKSFFLYSKSPTQTVSAIGSQDKPSSYSASFFSQNGQWSYSFVNNLNDKVAFYFQNMNLTSFFTAISKAKLFSHKL